jgi:hypothetical protein
MTNYKTVWRSPLRIGVAIGIATTYCACWANGFDMVAKLFFGGMTIILITFTLFVEG